MSRRAAALALVLMLTPAVLIAQDPVFTITVTSADVYKGPSTITPVIGHAPRGDALPVLRNLGSWVKIPWRDAPDGVAYVHVTTGSIAAAGAQPANVSAPSRPASPAQTTTTASGRPTRTPVAGRMDPPAPATARRERVAIRTEQGAPPITHVLGVGAIVGPTARFGATGRAWRDNRLGFQVGVTRDAVTSGTGAGRLTSLQIEPAIVYSLFDHVGDYFWIRPYVGSGLSVRHQTLSGATASAASSRSDNALGLRLFAGSEVTFAGAPRFALSVDVGYRRVPNPFAGFAADRFALGLAGHWYVR